MSGSTIQVESSNMQNILIALVVICAIVYSFIEFRRINSRFQELEDIIAKLQGSIINSVNPMEPMEPMEPTDNTDEIHPTETEIIQPSIYQTDIESGVEQSVDDADDTEQTDIMQNIINDVDAQVGAHSNKSQPSMGAHSNQSQPFMGGLFISVEPDTKVESTERIVDIDIDIDEGEDDTSISKLEDIDNEPVSDPVSDQVNEPVSESVSDPVNYEEYTIGLLKNKLTEMNLPTSGNKSKLIQRIVLNEK